MKKQLLLLFFLSPFILIAGGFQINLQGQKQTGMGHAGTGLCLDNASILFNPGALSFLDSIGRLTFGVSFIMPQIAYLEPYPGIYKTNTNETTGTPIAIYASRQLKKIKKCSIGLGIYNPFGSKVQWEDNWKGQFLIREIDLKTFFIQPTLSYKINDKVGFGVGFVYATGNFLMRKAIPVQDSLGNYGEGKLNGKASGYGFNAGLYIKATEKISIGVDYRSQVNVSVLSGTADFKTPSSLSDKFPNTNFSTGIKLPQVITLGLGYVLNKKIKLALDINYVGWKSYDSLIIDFTNNTESLKDIHSAREYQNTYIFRLGAQYVLNSKWTFRLGTYYDKTPIKSGYLTPETPDADKIGITIGASFMVTERIHLDASLLYIEGMKRTDTNIETGFGGTYKSRAFAPGLSLDYIF